MKLLRIVALAVLGLGVAGCTSVDTVTRNQPVDDLIAAPAQIERSYTVTNVVAMVPASLKVSERNGYYPFADIVWRGDPVGNRHMQLAQIFETAAARHAETLQGDVPVVAEVVLNRFHGVTERTRFSVGGVYNVVFTLTVKHAETGAIIEGPRLVEANLPAPGGEAALALEHAGQTEKVRMTDFLTTVLARELGAGPAEVAPVPVPGDDDLIVSQAVQQTGVFR